MIFDLILDGYLYVNTLLWSLVPTFPSFTLPSVAPLVQGVEIMMWLSSKSMVILTFGSIIFWIPVQIAADVTKFILRKIPGIS